jgi:hypothetical protein
VECPQFANISPAARWRASFRRSCFRLSICSIFRPYAPSAFPVAVELRRAAARAACKSYEIAAPELGGGGAVKIEIKIN